MLSVPGKLKPSQNEFAVAMPGIRDEAKKRRISEQELSDTIYPLQDSCLS